MAVALPEEEQELLVGDRGLGVDVLWEERTKKNFDPNPAWWDAEAYHPPIGGGSNFVYSEVLPHFNRAEIRKIAREILAERKDAADS